MASYGLDRIEETLLSALKPGKLETIVGRMLGHELLPNRVSRRFVVLPTSSQAPVDDDLIPIWIDQWNSGVDIGKDGKPKGRRRAFGSGGHPSTSLCLHALENTFSGAPRVLDIGTGSGILAIAAAKLGANRVLAIDIDDAAVQIAQSNVNINELDAIITVKHKSMDQLEESNFDLVLANLTRSVHLTLLKERMLDLLAPGGKIVLSGIKESEGDGLRKAVGSAGGFLVDGYVERGWVSFVVEISD
ncbi:MAG: 50S ribosomal protein L11 methyltransferase [Anaerolineales bacterium]